MSASKILKNIAKELIDKYFNRLSLETLKPSIEYFINTGSVSGTFSTTLKEMLVEGIVFNEWISAETPPTSYDRYEVCRKDGKMHYETWNGKGWAYNEKSIVFWRAIALPPQFKKLKNEQMS